MTVRWLLKMDHNKIAHVNFTPFISKAELIRYYNQNKVFCRVLEENEQIVGVVVCRREHHATKIIALSSLYGCEDYQRWLLDRILNMANAKTSDHTIYMDVWERNLKQQLLLKSMKFRCEKTTPDKSGDSIWTFYYRPFLYEAPTHI